MDRSVAATTDFNRALTELVTESCWGNIWAREGLDRRTRSLLNIVMLTALGRNHELGVHVKGAIRNGCTESEISEAILQAAIYCGVPAALEASRVASAALSALQAPAQAPLNPAGER